jgi:chitin synthase
LFLALINNRLTIIYLSGFAIARVVQTAFDNVPDGSSFTAIATSAFSEPAFRDLVISFSATYLMYLIASFVYLEPYHMFTSLLPYLLLLPSFINILQVYSFWYYSSHLTHLSNLNDISWGTKGDNTSQDLGGVTAVKGKDGKQTVEIDFPSDRAAINQNYEVFIRGLKAPREVNDSGPDEKTKQDDYFRNFRTKTVLLWVFTNALIVGLLTNDLILESVYQALNFVPDNDFNPYLKVSVRGFNLLVYLLLCCFLEFD